MRVIIIGAGLAGLCVAAGLAQSGHDVSIYERDQSAGERDQGFYIGLMPNTGIGALRSVGLAEAAFKSGRANTSLAFLDHTGESLFALRLPPAYAMLGISRGTLRKLLLDATLSQSGSTPIHWGHRFTRFEESESQVRVHFENGHSADADVLLGCDGVRSGVRAQRVGDSLVELQVVSVRGILRHEVLARHELLASGGFLTVGGGGCVFAQGFDAHQLLWSYSAAASTPPATLESAPRRLSWLREALASWHDPIPALVQATELAGLSEPYVLLDREPMTAAEGGRVILLGDAAHPMSPFQGQGGNMALVDAVDLAGRIRVATATDIPELVRQFERACLQRSHNPWLSSRRAVVDFHAANARDRVLEWRHGPLT